MNVQIIESAVLGSFNGTVIFPEIVGRLTAEGTEWYSANLLFGVSTHYAADGGHHQMPWPVCRDLKVAALFDGSAVEAAIRASQRGEIRYTEFLERIAAAGVVYYTVHLQGRKALYFGRHGDFHVEPFPAAK